MPHRFKLGERVGLAFGFHDQDASGLYEVTALLPTRPDGDPQYRVKGSDEREHVIGERQIGAPHSVERPPRRQSSHNPITNELNRVRDGQRDIDRQSMTRQGQSADKLFGAPVFDPTGKKIGTVLQIHGAGRSLLVIVEVGGFLGIGARPIALGESEIAFSKAEDGSVRWETTLTNESLKDRATVHEI